MALFPTYTFDENTDYDQVWQTTREMYVYLDAQGDGCCKSKTILDTMHQASVKMLAVQYNSNTDLDDVERWKKGIEVSYKLLKPLTP